MGTEAIHTEADDALNGTGAFFIVCADGNKSGCSDSDFGIYISYLVTQVGFFPLKLFRHVYDIWLNHC